MGTDTSAAPALPSMSNKVDRQDPVVRITSQVHLDLAEANYLPTQGDRVANTRGAAERFKPARITALDIGFTWAPRVLGADGERGVWRVGKVTASVQQRLRSGEWGEPRTRALWSTDGADIRSVIDSVRPTAEPVVTWQVPA